MKVVESVLPATYLAPHNLNSCENASSGPVASLCSASRVCSGIGCGTAGTEAAAVARTGTAAFFASAGGNAFTELQIPQAVITLKQGFGRLIRSLSDRGLLVLLDPRVRTARYGKIFLDSLPNYRRTDDITDVEKFFE